MEIPDHDPFAPFAEPALHPTVTLVGPLAQRDPGAPLDDTAERTLTGEVSFDDLLARARRRGFLAGLAVGAVAAAAAAAVVLVALSPATPSPRDVAAAARLAAPAPSPSLEVAAPSPPPAAVEQATAPQKVAAQRRSAAAEVARDALAAPGLDLRPPGAEAPPAPAPEAAPASASAPGVPDPASDPGAERASEAEPAPRRLEDGEVAEALAARRDAIDACVAATEGDAAGAARRFLLVLSVDPSGRVSDARIDDPAIDGTALGGCLARVAREMSFAPFDGEPVRVELPLRHASAE